jgi:hypothetical protein
MKRTLVSAICVGLLASACSSKSDELEKRLELTQIQKEYLEKVGWVRTTPDDKAYKSQVSSFFRWYFKEIDEYTTKHKLSKNFDEYLGELDKKADKEKGGQAELKKASYEYTKKMFDLFRGGNYEPLWTGTDKGMRLDIISASIESSGGKSVIRLPIVLWGAQRELRDEGRNLKKMVTSASFNSVWKLFDEKGKLFGEMNLAGDPAMKIDFPERFIAQFPPQMVLGYFEMEQVPAEIQKIEANFTVSSMASYGGDATAQLVWKLDAPAEWKLPAGTKWDNAQESVRPEDEIDPSKAPKAERN